MKPNAIRINPKDNVAMALEDIKKGETINIAEETTVTAITDIPFSHKVAIKEIKAGSEIVKFGEIIGEAKEDLKGGDWIHTHNIIIDEEQI